MRPLWAIGRPGQPAIAGVLLALVCLAAPAAELPIFDAHIHYSHDTYAAERWPFVVEHARLARQWLAELPRDVAEKIAFRNGEALFGGRIKTLKH